ncbi:asparagine synthase (glutamine-hydrolyzing) [Echinicola marina]|uniref:asparagine synthase (glutamine-hydrolyzing) n=1 Tax=Echinicola marina TaxID=2859768 RepID=UPI001CF64D67|nr:asparagine synthase (glutamine-hydrolyzing) [Echinicola marina]UCS94390.1 asparagine synthase (glutamine-hydrolyzing) [Echinicola marina]
MCGINLALNFPLRGQEAIRLMMESTRHRGPDQSSWKSINEQLFIAGNRLKTVDLGDWANQPISIADQYFLVWNGALYNAEELRNHLLQSGATFESRSDSEVLLRWLMQKGEQGLGDLEGMFALVFVDSRREQIIVARDSYGKKPLYYYHHGSQWLFSSEAGALVSSGLIECSIDVEQYLPYFYSRHAFPGKSFYESVKQLEPGEMLKLDFEGKILSSYKRKEKVKKIGVADKGQFKNLLTEAVLRHFQADVPVGVLLSGGADSSLLLHTWVEETGIPLHTFTLTFEDRYLRAYPDPKYAKKVAKKYNAAHHEVVITPDLVLENWGNYLGDLDQPIGDSASFISWMIAKEAKKYVKILVSGAGADELFSGYSRHAAFRYFLKNKATMLKVAKMGKVLPLLGRKGRKMAHAVDASDDVTFLNFSSLQRIPKKHIAAFLKYYPEDLPPYKAALTWDRQYYLVNDILKIHDNALMCHGIEGRAPYLDKGLVDLSLSLDEEVHLQLSNKEWIKGLLEDAGLKELAVRKKLGLGLPIKEWLKSHEGFREKVFKEIREFEVKEGRNFPEEMLNLAKQPSLYINDSFLQIWNLFVLAGWYRKKIK